MGEGKREGEEGGGGRGEEKEGGVEGGGGNKGGRGWRGEGRRGWEGGSQRKGERGRERRREEGKEKEKGVEWRIHQTWAYRSEGGRGNGERRINTLLVLYDS